MSEDVKKTKLSKEMETLQEIMKKHFKEEAEMDLEGIAFGKVDDLVCVNKRHGSDKCYVIFPEEWKHKDLKGVDLEELAAGFRFVQGYALQGLIEELQD